ncbi:rRNA-binding ribosome biosynthesis protein rpf2 [Saitoella coloradoensis]
MLRTSKPKNARAKRALAQREPKLVENAKKAIFIRGSTASGLVQTAMADLYSLKKPDAINFTKKNEVHPFEDPSSIEFWSEKNDSSLLVVGTHTKKRPHNLTWCRTFSYQVLDVIELGIQNFKPIAEFKTQGSAVGLKPLMLFNGPIFDTHPDYKHAKSLFIDFFRGEQVQSIDVAGLQYIISVSAGEATDDVPHPQINFRAYLIQTKKSGQKLPRIELQEMGPRIDFSVRRVQAPNDDVWNEATKKPKQLMPRTKKNVGMNEIGDKTGRIHVGRQDLTKMQTRKMKGLKKRAGEDADEEVVAEARSKKARTSDAMDETE